MIVDGRPFAEAAVTGFGGTCLRRVGVGGRALIAPHRRSAALSPSG